MVLSGKEEAATEAERVQGKLVIAALREGVWWLMSLVKYQLSEGGVHAGQGFSVIV